MEEEKLTPLFVNLDPDVRKRFVDACEKNKLTQRQALESILGFALPLIESAEPSKFIFKEVVKPKKN